MNYETTIKAEAAENIPADVSAARRAGMSGTTRAVLIGALIVFGLLLAVAAYFAFAGGTPVAAGDENEQAPVVTVIAPGQTTINGVVEVPGTIAARREMPVGIVGEGGRVISVPVDAGDWVRQEQVLAVVDRSVQNQQAAAQAAQIEVARADAELAQSNLDRSLQLVERGFVSKADVDRLTATRDAASARVKVAQAQLSELRARNARLNVVAPASGYVLERNVEPGQTVSGGTPSLFRIARGGEMEMLAQVGETQLASLSQGVMADVTPTGTDKSFQGQVWQLSPVIDPQSRQGTARIALPFARELRPGGFATARIQSGTMTATVLPESAVLSDDDGSFVYVVGDDNTAKRQSVTTGMVTAQGLTITDGLSGTEQVVLRAGGFLNPGETVKPRREGEQLASAEAVEASEDDSESNSD
ncbi:efflux RND transporter periplasmic adaptor subunit [Erythrobacter crassostreae]|uniref:Efflux RND transporter periplasmic adaptor subunit n=1 Tax=Erythrobacter crassostreae TaxID=2828328 RepID=A0A9X1F1M9_9SPHN|nr:efflux RND transporter periplasmic adaptor subunit [Erythrobacter crassostrea]MBV7258494.1 efflux RND transporter periplasmic adaptor subunit [Erythrobacter crassostrea]